MGKLINEPSQTTKAERVRAARERIDAVIQQQGIRPYDPERMREFTWPEADPNDEFLKMLREWRNEGSRPE